MKLPTDVELHSLRQLRQEVGHKAVDLELHMTPEQYTAYKQLIFQADLLRTYNGMKIVVDTPSHEQRPQ